jgi:hypothetical protein
MIFTHLIIHKKVVKGNFMSSLFLFLVSAFYIGNCSIDPKLSPLGHEEFARLVVLLFSAQLFRLNLQLYLVALIDHP